MEESPNSVLGKRKGTQKSLHSYSVTPGSYDKFLNCTIRVTPSRTPDASPPQPREFSLCTQMSKLSLAEQENTPVDEHATMKSTCLKSSHSQSTRLPLRQTKSLAQLNHRPFYRKPKSPQRKPPAIVPFLTKSSGLKAWDHDTRMQGMEDMTNMLLSSITELGKNGDTMKTALNIYKTRGKSESRKCTFLMLTLSSGGT